MELLLINIGNTFAQPGVWSGNAIDLLPRIPTAELKPELLPAGMPIAAVTVVPAIRKRFADTDIWYLSAYNQRAGVDFTQVDASTLGADRVANALALAELFPLPGISADCGTALTLEIVDADGVFRGGAIAPGRAMMRRSLAAGTAQLPEIPFSTQLPEHPGSNTVETIRFGVDRGAVGLMRELLSASLPACGKARRPTIVATGGGCPVLRRSPRDSDGAGRLHFARDSPCLSLPDFIICSGTGKAERSGTKPASPTVEVFAREHLQITKAELY